MAVPKRRTSRSKRNMRRANHDKVTVPNLSVCDKCGSPKASHHVCHACGFYKGRAVLPVAGVSHTMTTPLDLSHAS